MKCKTCSGRVEWQGPLSNLTHTKCLNCGAINNQELEDEVLYQCSFCGQNTESESVCADCLNQQQAETP